MAPLSDVSGFISGLSVVFCWSVSVLMIAIALYCSFKSGSVMPPALFFLKIALAIQDLLWFHTNFKIVCSVSVKNATGILIGIAMNL